MWELCGSIVTALCVLSSVRVAFYNCFWILLRVGCIEKCIVFSTQIRVEKGQQIGIGDRQSACPIDRSQDAEYLLQGGQPQREVGEVCVACAFEGDIGGI